MRAAAASLVILTSNGLAAAAPPASVFVRTGDPVGLEWEVLLTRLAPSGPSSTAFGFTPGGRAFAEVLLTGKDAPHAAVLLEGDDGSPDLVLTTDDLLADIGPDQQIGYFLTQWLDNKGRIYGSGYTRDSEGMITGELWFSRADGSRRVFTTEHFGPDVCFRAPAVPWVHQTTPDGRFLSTPCGPHASVTVPFIAGDLDTTIVSFEHAGLAALDADHLSIDPAMGIVGRLTEAPHAIVRVAPPYTTADMSITLAPGAVPLRDGSTYTGPIEFRTLRVSPVGVMAIGARVSPPSPTTNFGNQDDTVLIGDPEQGFELFSAAALADFPMAADVGVEVIALSPQGAAIIRAFYAYGDDYRPILYLYRRAFGLSRLIAYAESAPGFPSGATLGAIDAAAVNDSGVGVVLATLRRGSDTLTAVLALTAGPGLSVLAVEGASIRTDDSATPPAESVRLATGALSGEQLVSSEGRTAVQATFDDATEGIFIFELGDAPCNPADLAEPYAVLDVTDVTAFLTAFAAQDPAADLEPDGDFDFLDVFALLVSFGAGCP